MHLEILPVPIRARKAWCPRQSNSHEKIAEFMNHFFRMNLKCNLLNSSALATRCFAKLISFSLSKSANKVVIYFHVGLDFCDQSALRIMY